jgi:hypothetical protein|tara:strand:- start:1263 stop:1538 length:276 start_codon:yes stop_codon:yes gene_type:complete
MSSSDVFAVTLTSTGTAYASRVRLRQIAVHTGSGAATLVLRDGGASGETKLDMKFTSSQSHSVNIPDNGILFQTDVHATIANHEKATFFFS